MSIILTDADEVVERGESEGDSERDDERRDDDAE